MTRDMENCSAIFELRWMSSRDASVGDYSPEEWPFPLSWRIVTRETHRKTFDETSDPRITDWSVRQTHPRHAWARFENRLLEPTLNLAFSAAPHIRRITYITCLQVFIYIYTYKRFSCEYFIEQCVACKDTPVRVHVPACAPHTGTFIDTHPRFAV